MGDSLSDEWTKYYELLDQLKPIVLIFEGDLYQISPLKLFVLFRESLILASYDSKSEGPYEIIQAVIDRTFKPLYREEDEIQRRLDNYV